LRRGTEGAANLSVFDSLDLPIGAASAIGSLALAAPVFQEVPKSMRS